MKNLETGIITGEITIGNAFVYRSASVEPSSVRFKGTEAETEAFRLALEAVKNELSVLALTLVQKRIVDLCFIVTVIFKIFLINTDRFRNLADMLHFCVLRNFNIG